jgi:hypothetical protein
LSENPLLPHRKLKELHALMLRCRDLERKQRSKVGHREALLAATSINLLPGDLLCGEPGDTTIAELAPVGKTGKIPGYADPRIKPRMPAFAAMARGLQAAGGQGVVLAYTHASAIEPGWFEALTWAIETNLPLIVACADSTGGRGSKKTTARGEIPLTWLSVNQLSNKIRVPILAVDGEDAVAVFRCTQESVIRARYGGGPAIIWAVTNPANKPPTRSNQPVARLESYLKVRNIKLPKRS